VPEFVVLFKADSSTSSYEFFKSTTYLVASEILAIFCSFCLLIDGFSRIKSSIQQGECICKKGMIIVMTAYFLLLIECIGWLVLFSVPGSDFGDSHDLFVPISKILFNVFYCAATTILASIMFKLGEQQFAA
jgi:hypothetical protein